MVLASIVSCGKTNSVGSSSIYGTSPITVGGASETQLGTMIDTNQFGSGMATYYITWSQLIMQTPTITYQYGNYNASSNCKIIWGVFKYCTSTNSSGTAVTRSVMNSTVDVIAKKNELKAIINNRTMIQAYGTSFYIRTNDGRTFVIDTRYPLQANPVSVQQADGKGEVFVGAI